MYWDKYHDQRPSWQFEKVAYERYLTPGTDLHCVSIFVVRRFIMCGNGMEEVCPWLRVVESEWDLKRLIIVGMESFNRHVLLNPKRLAAL